MPMVAKTDKQLPWLMRGGMLLVIIGAFIFLAIGFFDSSRPGFIAGVVAWACGAATCIYSSAAKEIKKLRQRVSELQEGAG